jgi:hypothetical protein
MDFNNLLTDPNFSDYEILMACGLILACSLFYLIRSNYIAIPSKNMEPLTNEEIEAVFNENAVTIASNESMYAMIDSDSDTDIASDYQSISDNESILDVDTRDLDLFFMPNVDFDVCSIQELKIFEINSLYYRELAEKLVTQEELTQLIYYVPDYALATNWIND